MGGRCEMRRSILILWALVASHLAIASVQEVQILDASESEADSKPSPDTLGESNPVSDAAANLSQKLLAQERQDDQAVTVGKHQVKADRKAIKASEKLFHKKVFASRLFRRDEAHGKTKRVKKAAKKA